MSSNETSRPETPGYDEIPGSRKSLFRGKRGKRLSESVSSSSIVVEHQEKDASDKRMSVLRKVTRRNQQDDVQCKCQQAADNMAHILTERTAPGLKHRISSPFGFQHLTHTDRQHFEQASGDKLASGFRSVQPSQKLGQGVTGVKIDQTHIFNTSSDDLSNEENQTPAQSSQVQQSGATGLEQKERPALRLTRSVESFSQPGVNLRKHRHSQSVLAPPRLSSLSPLAPIDDLPEADHHGSTKPGSVRQRSKRESGVWDSFSLSTAASEPNLTAMRDDAAYVGHAFTTPDDIAIPAMPASFSPSLDDVTEEPEYFSRPRAAPLPPFRGPSTPRSPQFDSTIFNNPRSPIGRGRNRGISHTSPRSFIARSSVSRPVSQTSETLGSGDFARHSLVRKPSTKRRQSNTWRAPEESWEDSIDYIYEHALEADCDFEWDRASNGEADEPLYLACDRTYQHDGRASSSVQPPLHALQPAFEPARQYQTRDFRVSLLVPNVPDLVPTSATSVSTPGTGLTTPCDPFQGRSGGEMGGFLVSPSLLVPQEYKDDQEHLYEDLLNAYEDSERHFPMLDARYSATSSARSRRSSYDSSLMSSAQSSGMWSSPVRRSASSAGSIPDLVPSRRTRRDLGFSLVVDQLSDSVASLAHLDEEKEDEDVTPPGRILENRTFPADDDPEELTGNTADIGDELKASLELARRGSQRSPQAPARHHKQARSDGATNLLAVASGVSVEHPTKSRGRAATASYAARSPLLSLFPAPPRNSPNLK
jgi:hypothetical protein